MPAAAAATASAPTAAVSELNMTVAVLAPVLFGIYFGLVRNPVFTAMAFTGIGLTLMTPNITHGDTYRRYATTTGRFLPSLGRLPS